MTRRVVSLAVGIGALFVACGGQTAGSPSGLSATKPIAELSDAELQQLCDWFGDALGGSGAVYECGDVTIEVDASEFECTIPPECTALVSDVEECAREQRAAFEACALGDEQPACERLAELCPDMSDDVLVGPGNTSVPAICTPGSTVLCACPSGAMGVEVCSSEGSGWSACECASTEPACVEGQAQLCSCADGASGAQSCEGNGTWGACNCEPVGTCDARFCPSSPGATACCVAPHGPCGADFGVGCEYWR